MAGNQASKQNAATCELARWGKRCGSGAVRIPGEEEVVAASHGINENPSSSIPQVRDGPNNIYTDSHQKSDCVLTACIHAASTIIRMRRL